MPAVPARARHLGALVLSAVALTGCGVVSDSMAEMTRSDFSEQEAPEIARTAEAAMKALTSVRITGSLVVDSKSTLIDLRLADDGRCSGNVRVTGGDADIRQTSEATWLRGEGTKGKWVKAAEAFPLCDLDMWVKGFKVRKDGTDGDGRTMEVGDEVSLDDTKAVEIITLRVAGVDDLAYVSSKAPHHVLKFEVQESSRQANIAFAEFDEEFEVEAPAPKDVR